MAGGWVLAGRVVDKDVRDHEGQAVIPADPHKANERIRLVERLIVKIGLGNSAANDLCYRAAHAVGCDVCLISLASSDHQHIIGSWGLRASLHKFTRSMDDLALESGFFEVVDFDHAPEAADNPLISGQIDRIRSMIACTLLYQGKAVGSIFFGYRSRHTHFTYAQRRAVLAERINIQHWISGVAI